MVSAIFVRCLTLTSSLWDFYSRPLLKYFSVRMSLSLSCSTSLCTDPTPPAEDMLRKISLSEDVHPAVSSGVGIAEDTHRVWCGDIGPRGDIPGIKVCGLLIIIPFPSDISGRFLSRSIDVQCVGVLLTWTRDNIIEDLFN